MSDPVPLKGVPGILRPFKEYLEKHGFVKGDQIVYYGVPGTCTPFIELLAFAVRGLGLEQVFVPYFKEEKARKIVFEEEVGMKVSKDNVTLHPKALIIMGGLAMPNVPVTIAEARIIITRHPEAVSLGICFMSMFEKAGWRKEIKYDLLIDANIDPVTVETHTMTLSERSQYLISLYNLTHPGSEHK
jgi:hypothetical protein